MKPNSIKDLSIQISLSGLSFCILNRSTNTVELLHHIEFDVKVTPFEVLNQLRTIIETNTDYQQQFDSVLSIYKNELSTLVPESLFDEAFLADYLKFNAKILKTDYISYDTIVANQCKNVYVPLVNINNYLFENYGSFVYKHASTILIETVLQYAVKHEATQVYINVNASDYEMLVANSSKLIFYNTFDYNTKEDFIYYILFTLEQLKLNPETVKIHFSGSISEESDLFKIVYKYVRFVDILVVNYDYLFAPNQNPKALHNNFILLNSFS
ncbi:DUF3822 family protein [uncultured Psychroserpens sp.]|uniref:DUF3822 family protein n=1 Tax=uncultured Psychroserpens sp. TaxID=255436 RepID=UPI0026349C08|nr:DUF3822 family protein [uncultured Psychroserpens sp.]